MADDTILEFVNINKAFPGVQALNDVSLSIRRGEVLSLVGENGAGKSTLMKILAGLYEPDSGRIILNGNEVAIDSAHTALKLGIAMVPQELNLVQDLSITENVVLGIEPHDRFGVIARGQQQEWAKELLGALGLTDIDVSRKLSTMTIAQQQMVQIARALAFDCAILIMDEPTAALSEREKVALFEQLRILNDEGVTILYISHRLEEIFEIADRISVLRDGELIGTLESDEATQDDVVRMMIGRDLDEFMHQRIAKEQDGAVVLEARGLTRHGLFRDVSFQLHRGEILGFAGLVGARRTETLLSVFGSPPPDEGVVLVNGEAASITSATEAISHGIGYVPEERKRLGLFPVLSVLSNITMPFLTRLQRMTVVERDEERRIGGELVQQLQIRTPTVDHEIDTLSGGNQQKAVLARWLGSGASILILDEPTRGIDVSAKADIHGLIGNLADQGKSIILISSELQELLSICDRLLVMCEGEIVGGVNPKTVSQEDVLRLAMFGAHDVDKESRDAIEFHPTVPENSGQPESSETTEN